MKRPLQRISQRCNMPPSWSRPCSFRCRRIHHAPGSAKRLNFEFRFSFHSKPSSASSSAAHTSDHFYVAWPGRLVSFSLEIRQGTPSPATPESKPHCVHGVHHGESPIISTKRSRTE